MAVQNNDTKREMVRGMFIKAETAKAYRSALYYAKKLSGQDQLEILDQVFEAAERLQIDRQTGLPNVEPAGVIEVAGKTVVVEVLR